MLPPLSSKKAAVTLGLLKFGPFLFYISQKKRRLFLKMFPFTCHSQILLNENKE